MAYFIWKVLETDRDNGTVASRMAKLITHDLIRNDFTEENDQISRGFYEAASGGSLSALPRELLPTAAVVRQLVGILDSRRRFSERPRPA